MSKEIPNYSERKHEFSMVMVKDLQKRTRIPRAFIEQMPEELSGITILQGPSGNGWPVKIMKSTNGTYLEDGWEAFVTDHSLTEGEILIFTYVTPMHFKVNFFGSNACEREDAFTVQASLKSPRGDEAKFTAKDTLTTKASHGPTSRKEKWKCQTPQGDEAKCNAKDTFTTKASHGPTSRKEKKKCQSPRRDAGKMASTSNLKALGAYVAARHFTNGLVRPNFVREIKHYFLHTHKYLSVPAFFVRKHLLKTKVIKLLSPNGRESRMKFHCGLPRCPSRISCGWIPFASANNIKEGDSCVFELVQEDTLQLHIFRC